MDYVTAYDPQLGRKPCFLESFPPSLRPRLLGSLSSITEAHSPGLSAHDKRNDDILTAVGASMPKILKDFLKANPFVAIKYPNLSESTLRHLMPAPHQGRNVAKTYKGLIDIKIASGRNDLDDCTLAFIRGFRAGFPLDLHNLVVLNLFLRNPNSMTTN